MKNKEKLDLLLKDLSSRLPFGVKIEFGDGSIETLKGIWYDEDEGWQVDGENTSSCLHAVKPVLVPMSTMTEEQCYELIKLIHTGQNDNNELMRCLCRVEFYHKNHIDYNNLTLLGLAKDKTTLYTE